MFFCVVPFSDYPGVFGVFLDGYSCGCLNDLSIISAQRLCCKYSSTVNLIDVNCQFFFFFLKSHKSKQDERGERRVVNNKL